MILHRYGKEKFCLGQSRELKEHIIYWNFLGISLSEICTKGTYYLKMFQEPLSVVTFISRTALFMRLLQLLTLKLALKEVYYKARHMKEQVNRSTRTYEGRLCFITINLLGSIVLAGLLSLICDTIARKYGTMTSE